MNRVAILTCCRTPFGRFGGALAEVSPVELGAVAVRHAVDRSGLPAQLVDEVMLGNCMGPATLGQVPGRQVALRAGLAASVHVVDINTACTAALLAVCLSADRIDRGQARVMVAGGFESMSQVPYTLPGARFGYRLGHAKVVDALTAALTCPITGAHMGVYASQAALAHGIDRSAQDRWAVRSQQRYQQAFTGGFFDLEIVPVSVPGQRGPGTVTADEQPRPATTYEKLAALPPAFEPTGTVTAGNAPGLNDGAAALVLASESVCVESGIKPLAHIIAWARSSGPPQEISTIPAHAARAALEMASLRVEDIDLWEINEAFAAVTLTSMQLLDVNPEIVNVNGGSIAIGHPVGATGARILMTLIYELRRRGGGYGLATICGAGANGCSAIVKVAGA